MSDEKYTEQHQDRILQRELSQLATEAPTQRDLWPDIKKRLPVEDTKIYNRRWMPLALAASLVVSVVAVSFSWHSWQQTQHLIALQQQHESELKGDSLELQIKAMEQNYRLAKSVLLAQIGMNSAHIDPDLLTDVKSNLVIIEQATSELKAAIAKQPQDPSLMKLLNATYQQELVVLSKLAKLSQGS